MIQTFAPRVYGVNEVNRNIETKLGLWDWPITFSQAQKVVNWYCAYYDLPSIRISVGRGWKRKGIYIPACADWKSNTSARIKIDPTGFVLAVPVHEIAHHYEKCVFLRASHGPMFKKAHRMMLDNVSEMAEELSLV